MNEQLPQIQILQANQEEEEIRLRDYWAVLKRRWWIIILTFFVTVVLTAVYLIRTPRQYEAVALVKLPVSGGGGGLAAAVSALLPVGPSSDIATEIEVIKGRDIAEKVIRGLGLDKKEENLTRDWRRVVSGFQGMLKVVQKGKTNMIEIRATSNTPAEAKDIANKVAMEYIKVSEASRQKSWDELIKQMSAKLAETKEDLERSRQLLHEYESKEGITTAFSPILVGGGMSKEGYGTQYAIPEVPQAVAALKTNIMQMEIRLEGLRKYLPEANPEVISLKTQIEENRRKLQEEEQRAIEKYNKQFGLTKLAAEVVFNQQLYSTLVSKQEELKAQYIMQNKSPEIVESALEPLYPSKPKRKLILMVGAVMGAFLGLGLALFREYLDNSIHTPEDVKRALDLPVLGKIPRLTASRRGTPGTFAQSPLFIMQETGANPHPKSWLRELYRESYRLLQLEVGFRLKEGIVTSDGTTNKSLHGQVLMVTSSLPEEGRSSVAANLAAGMAQAGKKVLLIDADPRNSNRPPLWESPVQSGLIDVLAGKCSWEDAEIRTGVDNLYMIALARGDNNLKGELFGLIASPRMEDFIRTVREQFSLIIFDSPAATLSSGSASLSSKVDGIILVVKANDTQEDIILQAKQMLQGAGGNILGVVLNFADAEKYHKYYK